MTTIQTQTHEMLLRPIKVGAQNLKNRVIMGSMHLGLEEVVGGFERMAEFYAERARGEVSLIVTGGISPNHAGRPMEKGAVMVSEEDVANHRLITEAVHEADGKIVLQLLHFGRYAKHGDLVGPSAVMAPINPIMPREMTSEEVWQTVEDFANAAELAIKAGYDGVEIMGSEGYLINEFTAALTNQRDDEWGGDYERRMRFPIEIVKRIKERIGGDPLLLFRLSVLDLVPDSSTLQETIILAKELEKAGVQLINTGIGWHESRVPTIATLVPRAAFAQATAKVAKELTIPVAASNRINDPDVAEGLLQDGVCEMVAMARPFLADSHFVQKTRIGRTDRINTCIACNQACIDHTMAGKLTSCLVNPRAANETIMLGLPTKRPRTIAVVGAGPAGMAAATTAAARGHKVTLFDAGPVLGGQFDIARRIPGKAEFAQTIRYFGNELKEHGVDVRLNTHVTATDLSSGFDEVVIATGITPRTPEIHGIEHPNVVSYLQVLRGEVEVGDRVAIIGAGGIGFDVATFLLYEQSESIDEFFDQWGVDSRYQTAGSLTKMKLTPPARQVTLLQRKTSKVGAGLGLTTGWIHRAELQQKGVRMVAGADYQRIDNEGLHIVVDGVAETIEADTIIVCAGQEPNRALADELIALGVSIHLVGGANVAAELDAKRAIKEATELADML